MSEHNPQTNWSSLVNSQLRKVTPTLQQYGFSLDTDQPHIKGERFLMKNITTTSGQKLILLGRDAQSRKVVIKLSNERSGIRELEHERKCRTLLQNIDFSYTSFDAPAEISFFYADGFVVSIQEYIYQPRPFTERSLKEQFMYALTGLQTQAGAHITTNNHLRRVRSTFGIRRSHDYIRLLNTFATNLLSNQIESDILKTVQTVLHKIEEQRIRIEQYCGFLTHTDFVPHNFRIAHGTMYLLDWSSLEFGNKHESWARFLNFMTLYNPELESLLITYIEQNRSQEERESLQLLRMYRLCELITYYSNTLTMSTGDLLTLNRTRVHFWHTVLQAEMQNKRVDSEVVDSYKKTRDQLRSDTEKQRQQNLH